MSAPPSFPPDEPQTAPALPVEAIPAGGAEHALTEAFAALALAVRRAEATAMACGRALDSATTKEGGR